MILKIFHNIASIRQEIKGLRSIGKTIGLVPTMGSLHQGHLDLVEWSATSSDITVVSIFINPIQFNNSKDLESYPRDIEKDLQILKNKKVDLVFAPSEKEVYPKPVDLQFCFGQMEQILEGKFRPGHFNGVAIVVSKLFHILQPDRAYFGQKDLQQVAIIKKLAQGLSFDLTIEVMPTVRQSNGLAFSTRNQRLTDPGKTQAAVLYKILVEANLELMAGGNWLKTREELITRYIQASQMTLEYLELVKVEDFTIEENYRGEEAYALCIAAYVEEVRL
ncbi:MAG: pantoate--beta-alanine ligase, partial [Cyclobacteriaceae bacterium]